MPNDGWINYLFFYFFIYPLFSQEGPIEIKINLLPGSPGQEQKVHINITHVVNFKQSKRKYSS